MDYIMVAPSYPPRVGGVERHIFEVHSALKRLGLEGRIVVFRTRPLGTQNSEDVIWLPFRPLFGWVPKTASLVMNLRLARLFQLSKPKVIHFHDSTIYPVVPFLKVSGLLKRTYITFHGWEGKFPPAVKMIRKRKKIVRAVQGSIAIGAFIQKWYGTVTDVVSYGGVKGERYSSLRTADYNANPLRIGYFGRLDRDTGILEVVKAIRKYNYKADKRVNLDIYGAGPLRDHLLKIAEEDSSEGISVLPPVKDAATILVNYAIVVASGYLTILEALYAERIVFAQYNNDLREDYLRMHPAASSIFICNSAEDLSAAISQCCRDLESVFVKCRSGWNWAKEQSWNGVAKAYVELWAM